MSDPISATPETGHELVDAPVRPIVLTAVGIAAMLLFSFLICVGVFRFFVARTAQAPNNPMATNAPEFPPAPRIEVTPSLEYKSLHADEDRILSTYGWVDRKRGLARIPVDRAIDLQLQRGFQPPKEATSK